MSLRNFVAIVCLVAMAFMAVSDTHAQDTITFQGGNINDAANWLASDGTTTGFPVVGDTGVVDIDANFVNTSGAGAFSPTGDIVFGGGSVLTAGVDIVGTNPASITFNDVTVNVNDDIFTGGANGNFIFNAGSTTNVDDDFEANGGGTITVNGGTHNVGIDGGQTGNFGSQRLSTLNWSGGTVTAPLLRATAGSAAQTGGGSINISGTAEGDFADAEIQPANGAAEAGSVDFDPGWTGNISVSTLSTLAAWETFLLTNGDNTFGGSPLDAATFNANFQVISGELSLIAPIADCTLADVDTNGIVDFNDIPFFVNVLLGNVFQCEADCDENGIVDFNDIPCFVAILLGTK